MNWQPKIWRFFNDIFAIDWLLLIAALLLSAAGLVTMYSFSDQGRFFGRQIIWLAISVGVFFFFSLIDWRFLRRSGVVVFIFIFSVILLLSLFFFSQAIKGSERWLNFGIFAFQPSDPAKLALIILLSKYFSRRHVEIAHLKHIILSGLYAFVFFLLIFLQPNLSSAIIIFFIWFGMVMVSGISKKHVFGVLGLAVVSFLLLWGFALEDYQKQRIATFVDPLADTRGAGYNALQSVIAVGSGQWLGKGVGFGTQSRLRFLPEYQTDFIFAAFAEEWGFIGALILLLLFGTVIWRIVKTTLYGASNFEVLFGAGLAIWLISHFTIHVGMNVGLLPVTGIALPFMSYGGSHLITEFALLGIIMGMRKYNRSILGEEKEEKTLI